MKVTDVKPYFVDPGTDKNWLFVKVETSEGISGWGEAYTLWDRERSIEAYVNQIKPISRWQEPF